jgi:hypothetical protein
MAAEYTQMFAGAAHSSCIDGVGAVFVASDETSFAVK